MDMIGKSIEFEGEGESGKGMITDEAVDSIYIQSGFFTGWMFKAEYFELLGLED